MTSVEERNRRRVVKACRTCRLRKVRCSGTAPCRSCTARNQQCVFEEADRRIVVSERHLRDLQRRASALYATRSQTQSVQSPKISDGAVVAQSDAIWGFQEHTNSHVSPLPETSTPLIISDESGKGNNASSNQASTWSFVNEVRSIRGLQYQKQHVRRRPRQSYGISLCSDSDAKGNASDMVNIPRLEYITHLAHVVDFHINRGVSVFEVSTFLKRLLNQPLPHHSQGKPAVSNLWLAQVSIVVALGKLHTIRKSSSSFGPPGVEEFLQCMKLLPSNPNWKSNSLLLIETFYLLSIYAQAADLHDTAYLHAGQASRLARLCKLDRRALGPSQNIDFGHIKRLWWSVCLLDRITSAVIGVKPDYCVDEEELLGDSDCSSDFLICFNLLLTQRLSCVLDVVDSCTQNKAMDLSFIEEMTIQLAAISKLGHEAMITMDPLCSGHSLVTISRSVATLYLLYCHCIIIATKPIVLDLIKYCLDQTDEPPNPLPKLTLRMVRTCINASSLSLNIIHALHDQNLLDLFMFLDLEICFLSALSLILSNVIIIDATESSFVEIAKSVLEEMSHAGNIPATALLYELEELSELIANLDIATFDRCITSDEKDTKIITMIRDGQILNKAILGVIETTDLGPENPDLFASGTGYMEQGPLQVHDSSLEKEASKQATPVASTIQSSQGMSSLSDGIFLHDSNPLENWMTFDNSDLEWLDSVQ